ncbi:hypothetical protein AB3662_18385 [Sorangium cellulosum]|uniref:pectate lyase family protein n=1 Tax=Sorangium cellulosum TaxID=56 RepID=UPI003D9A9238
MRRARDGLQRRRRGRGRGLGDDAPRVIRISGVIVGSGAPMLRVRSNKTLIGVGAGATIDGFGFDVSGWTEELAASTGETCTAATPEGYTPVSNVIIRNLTFVNSPDDAINIPCFSHHVWVDHNTFERSHDGSVDVKRGSDWVTVSWNHFHQTVKSMLLGHDDGNGPIPPRRSPRSSRPAPAPAC